VDAFRTWTEIDLDALTHNLDVIRRVAGGARIMLIVKADAYGHGAVAIAHHAVHSGVGALGVGTSSEALELRRAGVRLPILVLGTVVDEELSSCLRHDVHIGLHSSDRRASLQQLAHEMGTVAQVHLNVDTGMGRLGVSPARALELLREVYASSHLRLAGVMTHVSSDAGAEAPSTALQLEQFERVLAEARAAERLQGWIHVANSAAIFTGLGPRYDTIRPGLAAFGAMPLHVRSASELQPVMSLRTRVVFLKDVPAGTPVGYSSTWKAPRATRIATLPIGYADGLPWRNGGCGEVLIHGHRAPIVGRVSMDYTTVDVGHIPGLKVGDVATLLGSDGDDQISLEEIARQAGTIPYEICCSIGRRVARVFTGATPRPSTPQPTARESQVSSHRG